MIYETSDVEERNVTLALRDLFSSIAAGGDAEDPMALVCRALVRSVAEIEFAFFCREDDSVGVIAARKPDCEVQLPPPDVQRRFVAHLRRHAVGRDAVTFPAERSRSLLPAELRGKLRCHACTVVGVMDGPRRVAVLAVFSDSSFEITSRQRAWLSLFADAAAALASRAAMFRRAAAARDAAMRERREQTLAMTSARSCIRSHLLEISKAKERVLRGSDSLLAALGAIEASAKTLRAFSDVTSGGGGLGPVVFRDFALGEWVRAGMKDPRPKAIVALRGAGKSAMLHAILAYVLSRRVPESRVALIDFEDPRFRRFRTASDVVAYLDEFTKSDKPYYLFLDEVGMVEWHADLLRRLAGRKGWNVWLVSSTSRAIDVPDVPTSVYRAWANPAAPRSRDALERAWSQIFMLDVVCGMDHPDIRAKEKLAEYFSDHLGEAKSLREVADDLQGFGRSFSPNSIKLYRQALVDAYLLEVSEIYDVFERAAVKSASGRVFWTDLELRLWRFGSAPEHEEVRLALNRLYLELRRRFDKVYTPRDHAADFVTLDDDGSPRFWSLSESSNLSGKTLKEKRRGGRKPCP